MTQPTIAELRQLDELDPATRAAVEFAWAFTEWWEAIAEDDGWVEVSGAYGEAMQQAYERWRNLRG